MVAGFRSRPLDAGPYAFVWLDALTQKVREGGLAARSHTRNKGPQASGKWLTASVTDDIPTEGDHRLACEIPDMEV